MPRTLLVLFAAAAALSAQEAVYPVVHTAVQFDSGWLANPGAAASVVWSHDITVEGAWVQVHFRDTNLPAGSRLRIFAPGRPDWVHWHDAGSLRDYRGYSCQFLGPTARVELVAAPGTTGNRVLIDDAIALQVDAVVEVDTICGTSDDRVLSSDPRSCRLDSSCSAWLFGPYAVGTAGHCMGTTAGHILHFNAPLSTSGGSTQPAHPNDQYAMEAFHPFLNGGVGSDWSVSAAVRNSNTGLFPGQAQGSWYDVVPAPAPVTGVDIRITGYGTGNGTSGSPTWNQAQKTHVGPRASTATATAVSYRTDTTGGNSGSPVIWEQTGQVVGVHTHGGCTSSGGANSGTDAVRSDWTAARAQVAAMHTVGEYATFGTGCGSPSSAPALSFSGIPEIGRTVTVRATGLGTQAGLGAFVLGFSTAIWNGNPLPQSLAPYGLEGCEMWVRPDFSAAAAPLLGTAQLPLNLPANPTFVGTDNYFQYLGLDASAPNTVGAVATGGGRMRIGN